MKFSVISFQLSVRAPVGHAHDRYPAYDWDWWGFCQKFYERPMRGGQNPSPSHPFPSPQGRGERGSEVGVGRLSKSSLRTDDYARGFTMRNPGKRAKSRSVVARVAPCSMANAAKWASMMRGP